jgi:hypothetical protein
MRLIGSLKQSIQRAKTKRSLGALPSTPFQPGEELIRFVREKWNQPGEEL